MPDTNIEDLEKRIASLEQRVESGQKNLRYIMETWQETILQFAHDFGIENPRLEEIANEFSQKQPGNQTWGSIEKQGISYQVLGEQEATCVYLCTEDVEKNDLDGQTEQNPMVVNHHLVGR